MPVASLALIRVSIGRDGAGPTGLQELALTRNHEEIEEEQVDESEHRQTVSFWVLMIGAVSLVNIGTLMAARK